MIDATVPERLRQLAARIKCGADSFIGYPATRLVDFSPLYPLMDFLLNNIGDPFYQGGSYKLNTHDMEREVIRWFGALLRAPEDDTWGYVTSGGTEGNMYGLYLAREAFPDGIVYFSADTHYSVAKIIRLLQMPSCKIGCLPNGEMDYAALAEDFKKNAGRPAILFANIGTTMRGAIDDMERMRSIVLASGIKDLYIHADAALSGLVLPFVENPPAFDFAHGIDSISISGHKLAGVPMPCGVVLARSGMVNRIMRGVEYIGSMDATILGSRSGIATVFLWYVLNTMGHDGFRRTVAGCLDTAEYALRQMILNGIKAWRNPHSLTVVFPRCTQETERKWQLATEGGQAHLIAMPHVTHEMIDKLIRDIKNTPQAVDPVSGGSTIPLRPAGISAAGRNAGGAIR